MSDPHRFARWHKQNPGVKAPYKAWQDLGQPDVPDGPAAQHHAATPRGQPLTAEDLAPHAAKMEQVLGLVQGLHAHLTGPRRVIKDEHGRPVAVQTGAGFRRVTTDPQTGRPTGVGPLEN